MQRQASTPAKDQGWSWVVLTGSFLSLVLLSLIYTTGLFNIFFLEVFHMNKQTTAWVASMQGSLMALCGPLSSAINNRLGPRKTVIIGGVIGSAGYFLTFFATSFYHVFITFGLMTGVGFGIAYLPCIVIIGFYFEKFRNLSFGIVNTAFGLGVIVLPFLIKDSIDTYGWRGCMLIMSAVFLHVCISGAVFRPVAEPGDSRNLETKDIQPVESKSPRSTLSLEISISVESALNHAGIHDNGHNFKLKARRKVNPDVQQSIYDGHNCVCANDARPAGMGFKSKFLLSPTTKLLLADRTFHLTLISLILAHAGNFIPYVHFPAYAIANGASVAQATTLVSMIGIFSIISRLIGGALTNLKGVSITVVYLTSLGITATLLFCSGFLVTSYPGRMLFAACLGFFLNWCNSLLAPLTVELFTIEHLTSAFGIECFMCGIGILIGPPLAGFLYDISGKYSHCFYAAGGLTVGAGLFIVIILVDKRLHRSTQHPVQKNHLYCVTDAVHGENGYLVDKSKQVVEVLGADGRKDCVKMANGV